MTIANVLAGKGSQVLTIRSDQNLAAAIRILHEGRIGALVVVDRRGKLVGMLSERDLVRAVAEQGAKALETEVDAFMTPDVTTCALEDRIDKVMMIMTVHRIRHLPVMDRGRIVGLVSIGDLVKHRLDEKEIEANVLLDIARAHP